MTAFTTNELDRRPSARSVGGSSIGVLLISMVLFAVTFLLYLLAPLALIIVACGGMYWVERVSKSRQQSRQRAQQGANTIAAVETPVLSYAPSAPQPAVAQGPPAAVTRPGLRVGSGRPGGVIVVDEPEGEEGPLAMPEWMSARRRRT